MMDCKGKGTNSHIKYLEEILVTEILSKFENEVLEDLKIECATGLDGFMSTLYNIILKTKDNRSSIITKERMIIVKLMRGDEDFRETSKSYVQFQNEICLYEKILPAYDELLKRANITDVSVEDWVAHCYAAKFGFIPGLSAHPNARECVLALENLKPQGYRMGPQLYLDRNHLLLMAKKLGQYHSMSYVLQHDNRKRFDEIHNQIIPLPFIENTTLKDVKSNLYGPIYRVAFNRFFDYFDRIYEKNAFDKNNSDDVKFVQCVEKLRQRYFKEPTLLLEHLRTNVGNIVEDMHWAAILHGDFNRNNVMFRYNQSDEVEDVKFIDFQELRFASPAIDLSFFMFFNIAATLRAEIWMDILKAYHNEMYEMMEKTLRHLKGENAEKYISENLHHYSFKHFEDHFSRYAFYGVIICLHYLPWLLCTKQECSELSHYFAEDMHGEDFYKISMTAGGDKANEVILEVVRFASKMGYMNYF